MSLGRRLISTAEAPDVSLFKTILYAGDNSTSNAQTGVGFQPDLVWVKQRTDGSDHVLFDAIRGAGAGKSLSSNATYSEGLYDAGYGFVKSFDADGFTVSAGTSSPNSAAYTNETGDNYVAWCFKAGNSTSTNNDGDITSTVSANPDAGFSIVKYTPAGGGSVYTNTVGHGLTSAPEIIIQKATGITVDWYVHTSLIDGSNDYLELNTTDQKADNPHNFAVTSTTFTDWGWNGNEIINYCFHSVSGVSKMEAYTGTGSTLRIYTTDDNTSSGSNPFEPSFLIIKRTDSADAWQMYDNQRGVTKQLMAQSADAEYTQDGTSLVSFNSDGFTLGIDNSERVNKASAKYLFMAFK